MREMYVRTEMLLGEEGMERLKNAFVCVVGLGGVGGHCAEALARAGVGRLHLIDGDTVDATNLNRQIVAAKSTLGRPKAEAMRERIEDVSDCRVSCETVFVLSENVETALPQGLSFIVDAVDTVAAKLALAACAHARGVPIVSAMGAGNRLDPCAFYVTDIFETQGDGLARKMRQGLRRLGIDRLAVVCSREQARTPFQTGDGPAPRRAIGSVPFVTGVAGLTVAGYCIRALTGADTTENL